MNDPFLVIAIQISILSAAFTILITYLTISAATLAWAFVVLAKRGIKMGRLFIVKRTHSFTESGLEPESIGVKYGRISTT